MMTTTLGENYLRMAEASGLRTGTLFKYAVRNALLPQITSLAIALSLIMSGAFSLYISRLLPDFLFIRSLLIHSRM